MKMQTIFLTVILTITNLSLTTFAEQPEHSSGTVDTSPQRQEADIQLSSKAANFIASYFWMPLNKVEEKYAKAMPQAMDKAMQGDESEISPMLAKLMGTLNTKQVERLVLDASQIREEELKKEKRDDRYIGLMDRFIWASLKTVPALPDIEKDKKEELQKLGKDEKATAFNQAFDGDMAKIKAQNDITLEKLKQAGEGNNEAVKWIKENLDQSTLLKWAEGQKKNGNNAAAEKVVDAVALKIGNQKVLDMTNGKETQRLFLGNDKASLGKALDGLFKSNLKGFGSSVVSFEPHPGVPTKQWFINDKGEFTPGAPAGFVDPATIQLETKAVATAPKPSTSQPKQNGGGNGGGGASPSNANFAKFLAIVNTKNCKSCHREGDGVTGTSFSNMTITKVGQSRPLSSFLAKLDKMNGAFSDSEVQQLREFAAGN